jgi:hypothetical protein
MRPTDLITSRNPVCSHLNTWQYHGKIFLAKCILYNFPLSLVPQGDSLLGAPGYSDDKLRQQFTGETDTWQHCVLCFTASVADCHFSQSDIPPATLPATRTVVSVGLSSRRLPCLSYLHTFQASFSSASSVILSRR